MSSISFVSLTAKKEFDPIVEDWDGSWVDDFKAGKVDAYNLTASVELKLPMNKFRGF